MDIKIYVVSHKRFEPMLQNGHYIPMQVGTEENGSIGYLCDNTGDNISAKAIYTELRAQYWFWKNTSTEYVGLVHYRRFFPKSQIFPTLISENGFETVMDAEDALYYLKDYDIIVIRIFLLPKSLTMRGFVANRDTLKHFEVTAEVIKDISPEYYDCYNNVFDSSCIYPNNMFICKKELADRYSEWVFPIFSEVEKRLSVMENPIRNRIMGVLGEVLLKTWIDKNGLRAKEMSRLKIDDDTKRYWPLIDYSGFTFEFEQTKNGFEVLKIRYANQTLYMGSKYSLDNDVRAILKQLPDASGGIAKILVIFGLASGDYLKPLFEVLPKSVSVVVVEPSAEVIKRFIDRRLYYHFEENYSSRLVILPFDRLFRKKFDEYVEKLPLMVANYPNYDRFFENEMTIVQSHLSSRGEGLGK